MDVQIDTSGLDAGRYQLLISQEDGKAHPVNVAILTNAPKLENLPVLLNQGVATQHYVLKGERLQLLSKLESPLADFQLGETSAGGTERNLTLQVKGSPKTGTSDAIVASLSDRSEPLTLANGVQITGPLPAIASSKLSLPSGMAITLLPEEFPAGGTLTALLDVKNIRPQSVLRLYCSEGVGGHPALSLGQQTATSSLQQLSPDQLFVSFDTTDFPAGCTLMAQIDNGLDGKSQPVELARLRRLPQIVSFLPAGTASITTAAATPTAATPVASPAGATTAVAATAGTYELRGLNLEMIGSVGWDANAAVAVPQLPTPIPGQGQQQSLMVNLPEPPNPKATLYIWLRGETVARATTVCLATCMATVPKQLVK